MDFSKEYILTKINFSTLSVYDLVKHVDDASFLDSDLNWQIYPTRIAVNYGAFSKQQPNEEFPEVKISQQEDTIIIVCSCKGDKKKLCQHSAQVLYSILKDINFLAFFSETLREQLFRKQAQLYGIEQQENLEEYFRLEYQEGCLEVLPKFPGMIKINTKELKESLLPRGNDVVTRLNKLEQSRSPILVITGHRFYSQLNFRLMHASRTLTGGIKNPIQQLDPTKLSLDSTHLQEVKFYMGVQKFQNMYEEDKDDSDLQVLRIIVENPLKIDVYFHDKDISNTISSKSLIPVQLKQLKAELHLQVDKKDTFYQIRGQLQFNGLTLPLNSIILKFDCFLYFRGVFYLIENADLLRVVKYFSGKNEYILVHKDKYQEIFKEILDPLSDIIHINYSYIQKASARNLVDKRADIERIIYLEQQGSFVSIVPVIRYGEVEIPSYSTKKIYVLNELGENFELERDRQLELQFVSTIMRTHPDFESQLSEYTYFYLHKHKFFDENWFLDAFENWRASGVTIFGFDEISPNRLNAHKAKISVELLSGTDWFNAHLSVKFGKSKATLRQLHRAIRHKAKFVQLDDGTRGVLPLSWIEKIRQYFELGEIHGEELRIPKINYSQINPVFESEIISDEVQKEILFIESSFAELTHLPKINIPKDLKATLRSYQKEGVEWLSLLDKHNFGACLADDMGLGKTLQIITLLLLQKEKKPSSSVSIIVVPTSLISNWVNEFAKFAPTLKILSHYGAARDKHIKNMHAFDVVLTSYGTLLSDIHMLKKLHFNYAILDESQVIKNPNSLRYKAARLIEARNRIVVTGTPIENNTFDLYAQISFACPGLLGSKKYFKDVYAIPIDKFQYSKRAVELQQKVKPFILRRTKSEVARELPKRTEMVIYCEMDSEQRNIYDSYEREVREYISTTDEQEIKKNSVHVLAGLTRLRQICDSPKLLKRGDSCENSVKIDVLLKQIKSKYEDHKILVFSQFVGMLDLVRDELLKDRIPFEYLTGQTKDIERRIENFQNNVDVRVFLISLKAGGVGLNLTKADYVYLLDPWWNPAVENQAIDRSHRIGQVNNVVAVRMICKDTVEEKILLMQNKKKKLSRDIVISDASIVNTFSKSDLLNLF